MEIASETEARRVRDQKRSDHPATVVASTDPRQALIMIAQQRAAHAQRQRLKRGALALLVLGIAAGSLALPRFRQRSLAAARTADVKGAKVAAAPQAPVAMAAPSAEMAAPSDAVAADDPAARCQSDFKEHQWRRAFESCGAAFDAAPSEALAMRIAHAHWAHGDAAGAGTWGRRALELGTQDADVYVLIGHAERAAGDAAAAVAAYRSYLERAPRGWHAARLRTAIKQLARAAAPKARVSR